MENSTENIILSAARKVFISKGFDGARMQEIADEAGMNKSLLHYYFRSKEKLFEAIFMEAFTRVQVNFSEFYTSDEPLLQKIETFIDQYLDILSTNPYLPAFVAHEINRNPERIISMITGSGVDPGKVMQHISEEIEKGNINRVEPQHLMVNILALCAFPFIAKPMLARLIFNNDAEKINLFFQQQKTEVKRTILMMLKKEQ